MLSVLSIIKKVDNFSNREDLTLCPFIFFVLFQKTPKSVIHTSLLLGRRVMVQGKKTVKTFRLLFNFFPQDLMFHRLSGSIFTMLCQCLKLCLEKDLSRFSISSPLNVTGGSMEILFKENMKKP